MNTDSASELEFFVLVARHGSLAAAARALDLTPPAATKRLAQMKQGWVSASSTARRRAACCA